MRTIRTTAFGTTILGVVALVLATTGCDPVSPPLHRHEAGYRLAEDGQVEVWFGDSCQGVTAIDLVANSDDGEIGTGRFESRRPEGATVSQLVWGRTPEGFEQVAAPPEDWRKASSLRVRLATDDRRTSTHVVIDSFTQEADSRTGEWFVQDQGWMTEPAYAALVGEHSGIFPLCPRSMP